MTPSALPTEFHPPQPLSEPLLHQGPSLPGGAREGVLLADRPRLRGQARGAGVPEAEAAGRLLLPHPLRAAVIQVSPRPAAPGAVATQTSSLDFGETGSWPSTSVLGRWDDARWEWGETEERRWMRAPSRSPDLTASYRPCLQGRPPSEALEGRTPACLWGTQFNPVTNTACHV